MLYNFRRLPQLIEQIPIPDSVTNLELGAFSECTSLKNIKIPYSVTSIGYYAFSGCSKLTSISVESGNLNYTSVNGVLYNKNLTDLYFCPEAITNLIIPNGVMKIRYGAFEGCKKLKKVSLPNSCKVIEENAFYGCSSLTNIIIPEGVKRIYDYTFYGCSSLESITIPKSVTKIEWNPFEQCNSLKNIIVEDGNLKYSSDKGCYIIQIKQN